MFRFLRRRRPIKPGRINEDWQNGDLAEMLPPRPEETSRWDGDGIGPEVGDVCKVLSVAPGRHPRTGCDGWYLELGGFPGSFNASNFRKVPPLNSVADARFVAAIRDLTTKVRA